MQQETYAGAAPASPAAAPAGASGAGRTFVVGHSAPRPSRSARENRLLSDLVSAAGELDADRLEHLVATARLLADKDD